MAELTLPYIIETLHKARDQGATELFNISGHFAGRLAAVLEERQREIDLLAARLGGCEASLKGCESKLETLLSAARYTLIEQRREFARGDIADLDKLEDAINGCAPTGGERSDG